MNIRKNNITLEQLITLEVACFEKEAMTKKMLADILTDSRYQLYTLDENPKGYLIVWDNSESYEVVKIGILPENRQMGYGKKLLQEFIDRESKRDIFLEVRESNIGARSLYESLSFEKVGQRKGYYQNGETALIYRYQKK